MTTASKLLHRRECPPGTYLLDTKSLRHLESAIVHLLKSHGVKLEPKKMLTRCVVCNGSIEPVLDEDRRQHIFQTYKTPEEVNMEGMNVYQCNVCAQGYWWSEKPTSSASRVKSRASRLLELCIRGGVPVDQDSAYFDYTGIDIEKLKCTIARDGDGEEIRLDDDQLDVVKWLQTEHLKNPLPQMSSAYASKETQIESLPFTNVTHDFVGHLDYILFPNQTMEVTELLYVPKTFEELNDLNIANGHLLPSYDWPSDHLAIGCRLSFVSTQNRVDGKDDGAFKSPKSDQIPVSTGSLSPPKSVDCSLHHDHHDHHHDHHHDDHHDHDGHHRHNHDHDDHHHDHHHDSSESEKLEPTTLRFGERCSFFEGPKSGPVPFPPGPPSAIPWCSFVNELETNPLSQEILTKAVTTSVADRELLCPLTGTACLCYGMGCLPKVPSLFEMAELRRQYRLKLQNAKSSF